jgi:phosphoglycolate phosphatase
VKRLSDRPPSRRPRLLIADLDGTVLGPGGSLFATPAGGTSVRAAEAVAALHDEGIELVLASGRSRRGMFEPARLLGATTSIAELGALIVERRGAEEVVLANFGAFRSAGSPYEEMARSGAGGYLLERFSGRLEPHVPWTRQRREATMLFRGLVEEGEAATALESAGYDWLELRDNGGLHGAPSPRETAPNVASSPRPVVAHAYHLVPRGTSKASAVRLLLDHRGIAPQDVVAVGDSPADVEIATEVGEVFVVANGVDSAEHGRAAPANAWSTPASYGDGFADAVEALLARA